MIKKLERLKNTVNKYMDDIRPNNSERKSVVSRRPSVYIVITQTCLWVAEKELLVPSRVVLQRMTLVPEGNAGWLLESV
jgi:hypothetical protein